MFPRIPQGSPPPLYQYPPPYKDISGPDSLSSPLLLETAIDASGEFWIGVVCNILTPGSFRRQYRTSCMEITQLIYLDTHGGAQPNMAKCGKTSGFRCSEPDHSHIKKKSENHA